MSLNSSGFKSPDRPQPTDFDLFIPWACRQLMLSQIPTIVKISQERFQTFGDRSRTKSAKSAPLTEAPAGDQVEGSSLEKSTYSHLSLMKNGECINVKTLYDNNDSLTQLKFLKNSAIPRDLMKVIALAVPFHKQLSSVCMDSGVTEETVYELNKLLPISCITDVCLDGTYIPRANYEILLDRPQLKNLSLARCRINDDIVKSITAKITFPDGPSIKSLSTLNLSSNIITDVGAKYIAQVLRGNRKLCYLNIADNRITDEGASHILDHLKVFVLTKEEVLDSKNRKMCYLRMRNELIKQMLLSLKHEEFLDKKDKRMSRAAKTLGKRKETSIDLTEKVENAVIGRIGIFEDPFSQESTVMIDSKLHSLGNNVLCYLNLAYNHLTYVSIKKVLDVLSVQNQLHRKPKGLINIKFDGNNLPIVCKEYAEIDEILGAGVARPNTVSSIGKRRITLSLI